MDTWATIKTWDLVTPPSRPDKWQLDIIRKYLTEKGNACAVAVLGSTIEFRDLLYELNVKNVVILEKNKAYYRDSLEQRVYSQAPEQVIWGDWLTTLRQLRNKFDIILSDLTSGNIPYSARNKFYKYISNCLKTGGLFIDRILTKQKNFYNKDELIQKYLELPVNLNTINRFNCEMLFCSTFLEDNKVVNTSLIYEKLLEYNIPRLNLLVNKCYKITPRECIWWYSEEWDIERKNYCKYLNVINEFDEPVNSAYSGRCKLFICNGV